MQHFKRCFSLRYLVAANEGDDCEYMQLPNKPQPRGSCPAVDIDIYT